MAKRLLDVDFTEVDINDYLNKDNTPDIELDSGVLSSFEDDMYISETPVSDVDLSHIDQLNICPRCKKPLVAALSIAGTESTCFRECPACGTLVNTFKPLPYQADFFKHPARFKMAAGGYGSGKSTADIQYVIKHMLLIPSARVCVAARTYPALEPTFLEEFKNAFPQKLLKGKNEQKHEFYLTNGSVLLLRSFDDPTKLKSMNLTLAVIVEASDVPESGFDMFKSRIRNTAAMLPYLDSNGNPVLEYDRGTNTYHVKYRVDARHILLETNPASNWVKKFLTESKDVRYYGTAKNEGYRMSDNPDPNKFTQIISTDANPYLPETYEADLSKGKSPAWCSQFLKGSFNFNNNLVFPNVGLCITQPHKLPREFDDNGRRVLWFAIGLDYGIVDYTHIVYTALSTETHKLYVYDELRINNADVKTIATEYRKNTKINGTHLDGLMMLPRFDGKSYNKRESDLHTIGGAFESLGLYFEPSFSSHEIRIIKMNSLINHGQMEIFSTCEYLIEEMLNYSFILDKNGNPTKTPKDGKDHGITALEFVVVELPHNLQEINMRAYIPQGTKFEHDKEKVEQKRNYIYNPLEVTNDNSTTSFNDNRFGPINSRNSFDDLSYSVSSPQSDRSEDDNGGILGAYVPDNF